MIIHRYQDVPVQYFEDRDLRALIDTTSIGLGRLSLAEEIPGHVESVDLARLQRWEARVRDRRSNRGTGDLAPDRWFAGPNRANTSAQWTLYLAG